MRYVASTLGKTETKLLLCCTSDRRPCETTPAPSLACFFALCLHNLVDPQFWADVEHTGMEVLEDEVVEKKSAEIFKRVAKACSVGSQITLILGGGTLLFRCVTEHRPPSA